MCHFCQDIYAYVDEMLINHLVCSHEAVIYVIPYTQKFSRYGNFTDFVVTRGTAKF